MSGRFTAQVMAGGSFQVSTYSRGPEVLTAERLCVCVRSPWLTISLWFWDHRSAGRSPRLLRRRWSMRLLIRSPAESSWSITTSTAASKMPHWTRRSWGETGLRLNPAVFLFFFLCATQQTLHKATTAWSLFTAPSFTPTMLSEQSLR